MVMEVFRRLLSSAGTWRTGRPRRPIPGPSSTCVKGSDRTDQSGHRGGAGASARPAAPLDVGVERTDGSTASVRDVLSGSYTDGYLVLHEGRLAAESYFAGMTSTTLTS